MGWPNTHSRGNMRVTKKQLEAKINLLHEELAAHKDQLNDQNKAYQEIAMALNSIDGVGSATSIPPRELISKDWLLGFANKLNEKLEDRLNKKLAERVNKATSEAEEKASQLEQALLRHDQRYRQISELCLDMVMANASLNAQNATYKSERSA